MAGGERRAAIKDRAKRVADRVKATVDRVDSARQKTAERVKGVASKAKRKVKAGVKEVGAEANAYVSYFGAYVSKHGAEALHQHKYAARDESIVLNYITDPLYCKWVTYFPTWLPPNIITLIGFAFTISAHIALAYYCPNLEGDIPSWLCVYNAFAILAYQAFDAMDGKQARRTGSGSALGLLFDHGCDALNTTVMVISMCCPLQLGATPVAACLSGMAWAGFFTNTLEEYYTGELYLGYINMPNEGLQIMAFLHLSHIFTPAGFWTTTMPSCGGLRRNEVAVIISCIPAVATMFYNLGKIVLTVVRKRSESAQSARERTRSLTAPERYETSVFVAAYRCLPPLFVFFAFMIWTLLSPSDILARSPRLLLWTIGISNAKLVTAIMLAHICNEEYHPFSRTIACLCTLLVHVMIQLKWHRDGTVQWPRDGEDMLLLEAFLLLLVSYVHMVYSMVHEVSRALGIYAFTILQKRPKAGTLSRRPSETELADLDASATPGGARRSASPSPGVEKLQAALRTSASPAKKRV